MQKKYEKFQKMYNNKRVIVLCIPQVFFSMIWAHFLLRKKPGFPGLRYGHLRWPRSGPAAPPREPALRRPHFLAAKAYH
jgi:hypothetical protein